MAIAGANVVAEGVVEISADAHGIPGKIASDIEGGSGVTQKAGESVFKSVFGGVVSAWAAVGAGQKIASWFTGAITGASDLNETMSKSSIIFGENASAIEAFGDRAARSVGLSKEAAIAAAASFGDMFIQLGFTSDAAASMSQATVQAAADLGSFNNLPTADVADRIAAAFRGEYDSLQAVIPNINAARVESEALSMTGKTTAESLTAQEKAAAILAIVQADGARAMGDFERTSDGAANQTKIMTAQMEDQQAKLGSALIPAWTGFLGLMNDNVIPAISTTVDWISQNSDTVTGLAIVIGAAVLAYGAISAAMAIHASFMAASAAAEGGLTIAQWALNTAMSANPIGLIIMALAALVAGIVWVATQTTFFQDVWSAVTTAIGTAWTWLWETVLSPVFTAIGNVFTWIYNFIILPIVTGIMIYIGLWAAVITWLWETVLSPVFAAIGAVFDWIYNTVIAPIVNFIALAIQGLGIVFTWLHDNVIAPVFAAIGGAFNWVYNSVIAPVAGFISGALRAIGDTVSAVFGGIADFIGSAFNAVLGVVRGPINGIIGLVNSAINGINSLHVTIPDWVPMVGGQTWGLSIPTIPMLARGGRILGGGAVLVGEAGPEILDLPRGARVTPLSPADRDRSEAVTTNVYLTQTIMSEDPIIGARQAAREVSRYLGV